MISTGINQPVTKAAVAVPANPSRARTPAAIQLGAAPAAANRAPVRFRRKSRMGLYRRTELIPLVAAAERNEFRSTS
jgi:hypothetical protein